MMIENFNIIKATNEETLERAKFYYETVEELAELLRKNNDTTVEMKEIYRNIKSMARKEFDSYDTAKFKKILYRLPKIKREYVFALQETIQNSFSDKINGYLTSWNLSCLSMIFGEYIDRYEKN